jgi:hypothetical protein
MSGFRITTGEAMRIELKVLKRLGFIRKGCRTSGLLSWTNGNKISVEVDYRDECRAFMKVIYTITDRWSLEKKEYDYKIWIEEIPSNLGKGNVLYFACPSTYKHCRILYMTYGSHKFYSRGAYPRRIYYEPQLEPHGWRANANYMKVNKQIEQLDQMRATYTYKGNPTKRALRIQMLEMKRRKFDVKRFSLDSFPKSFFKDPDLLADLMYSMRERKYQVKHHKKAANS